MSDWAAEHTLNWVDRWHTSGIDFQAAIEGAVRETLTKAAEVIEGHYNIDPKDSMDDAYDAAVGDMAAAVRALGATK